jgi:hypothetical protein
MIKRALPENVLFIRRIFYKISRKKFAIHLKTFVLSTNECEKESSSFTAKGNKK